MRFNYIITIHNKEDLLREVIGAVLACCREESTVYAVLDGCTDHSEAIVDEICDSIDDVPLKKVVTPDVHELLSINAGLQAAEHVGDGFNVVLQDDVILADFRLETKIQELHRWAGDCLGYVSLRLGGNFTDNAAESEEATPLSDFVESAYGHGLSDVTVLLPGQFAYRAVPIKSPVCIPFRLVREIGFLDERLAPYGHDDTEYAIRSIQAGYRNGVFALRAYSHIAWGGTRRKPHPGINPVQARNIALIRQWHGPALREIARCHRDTAIHTVPGMSDDAAAGRARAAWQCAREETQQFYRRRSSSIPWKVKVRLKGWLARLAGRNLIARKKS